MKFKWSVRVWVDGEKPLSARNVTNGLEVPITDTIFPIVQADGPGPWYPIGTGFFIGPFGLFATAKHVLFDREGNHLGSLVGAQLVYAESRIEMREIVKVSAHERADVAVGVLRQADDQAGTPNTRLTLTERIPEPDSEVLSIAFPRGEAVGEPGKFRITVRTAAIKGRLSQHYPERRDSVMLPGRCYQTTMDIRGGASGGPVAFGDGSIFGINSTGMESEDEQIGWVSSIADILDLPLNKVQLPDGERREWVTVRELASRGMVALD
ncbi:MAG: serine protease [Planctomycetaceae bacterium]|nr:MAG: serine protease [Planctomycetaceae bacterium]